MIKTFKIFNLIFMASQTEEKNFLKNNVDFTNLHDIISDVVHFNIHVNTLTSSQRRFIEILENWHNNPRNLFVLVSGGPGSGKTHTVVKTLQWITSKIIFMAPTARLAKKIGGQTIHSRMRLNWKKGSILKNLEEKLVNVDNVHECIHQSIVLTDAMTCHDTSDVKIVVIDEVGMIPFWLLYRIVEKFFNLKRKSKNDDKRAIMVVCMGDSCQLKPVTSEYNVFQVPFNNYFETIQIEMQESKRFTPEYKEVIDEFRRLMNQCNDEEAKIEEIFEFVCETFPVVEYLDENLVMKANRVLAYKNLTVQSCNDIYLNKIIKNKRLYKLYEYKYGILNKENPLILKSSCAVIVTENGWCPESNGTCLTFLHYDDKNDVVICSGEKEDDWKRIIVQRNPSTGRFCLTLGFASTIHKFQGETIDENNIVFCFDKCKDLHLVYTALSRVRNKNQILAVVL